MKLDVMSIQGESTGRSVELPENVFGVTPNEHSVYLAVKHYLGRQRQGTSATKERNAVVGSTRKIKRQKGTGTARAGDIKNPIFRGGGRTFGPTPRKFGGRLNKKVKQLARLSALSAKAQEDAITLIEDFTFDAPKTAQFAEVLKNLKCNGNKVVVILGDQDKNIYLSGRNIPNVQIVEASSLNVYDLLNADRIIIAENAIEKLNGESSEN